MTSLRFYGATTFACILVVLVLLLGAVAQAAEIAVPDYFDPRERIQAPDLAERSRIRFLTTTDFPPFNFIDQTGRLAGFNVDLARAVCAELKSLDKCQIQALPWAELETALLNGQGEAIIAGLAMTPATREKFRFTRPYLELPARFVVRRSAGLPGGDASALAGRRVGVVDGSAHEAMLRAWFPGVETVTFDRREWLHDALRTGRVDALFGDGVQLSFWLSSASAENCCRFFDGPYRSAQFLGEGLAIAVSSRNRDLASAFDHALAAIARNGRFAELYLRWFPNGIY